MYYEVVEVKYIKDYLLEVVFLDGTKGLVNLEEYSKRGGVFTSFQDINFFKQVFINNETGVLTWPGDIDIAPETIYKKATDRSFQRAI